MRNLLYVCALVLILGLVVVLGVVTRKRRNPDGVQGINLGGHTVSAFYFEGHQYLKPYSGGIIHSESCTNSIHAR